MNRYRDDWYDYAPMPGDDPRDDPGCTLAQWFRADAADARRLERDIRLGRVRNPEDEEDV